MKETVLVTGGAGYIGSHTAVELIQAGFDVVIADNLSNSDLQAVEGVRRITSAEVPFEQIDCCDLQAMRRLFERHEFRSVIHFAASKAVGESVAEPLKYYRNNLLSFLNVVELMCDFGRPNILFSSSCTVYGEPDAQPVTEQTPRKPATSPTATPNRSPKTSCATPSPPIPVCGASPCATSTRSARIPRP